MSTKQVARDELLRRETAALLYTVSEELGSMQALPSELYHRFSRQRNGRERNPVELLSIYVRAFGPGAWVRIRAYLDAHAMPDVEGACPRALRLEEQAADNEEDMAGLMAAGNERDERLHLDRLLRHREKADRLIAYYQSKLNRKGPRGARWRAPEQRRAG